MLSMDAMDMSGESSAGRGYAINGEIHKIRLNAEGERIGLGEYIPPRRFGFFLGGQREVMGGLKAGRQYDPSAGHALSWHAPCVIPLPLAPHSSACSAGRNGCKRSHGGA